MRFRRTSLALLSAAALAAGIVVGIHRAGRDVHGSASTDFVATTRVNPVRPAFAWPQWGLSPERARATPSLLRPPYRIDWAFHAKTLLEFPPALAYGRLYLPTFTGQLVALAPPSGRVLWRYESGRCAWASPAVADGLVVQTFLLRPPRCQGADDQHGLLIAFNARTGVVRWQVALPPTESSPLVAGGLVWVGDWSGAISAYDLHTGRRRWTFDAHAPVKSSPALAGGRLFVGTYGGRLYALDPWSGKELWHASVQRRVLRSGRFYSTPAVAHSRVYLGATDGKVYAYGTRSGKLRWSFSTGGYVYGSPAIWRALVLIGSYDGRMYALDAATGRRHWAFDTGGPISGSPTVLGDIVYVSNLAERTFALAVATGRQLWTFPDGKYSAGIADSERFYLVGYNRLFAMSPRHQRRK